MSESAILQSVMEQIKTVLTLPDARWIDIRPDGKPASAVGPQAFISVHSEGQRFGTLNNAIDEYQKVGVTVSLRTTESHIDYWGLKLRQTWEQSLGYAVRRIAGAIHLNPRVLVVANSLLETAIASPFCEMLSIKSIEAKREQGTRWWGLAETSARGNANPIVGWSQTLHFEGARRIQSMDYFS